MKLRKISVPYEFIAESDDAVAAAVALASKAKDCAVELLYVIVHYAGSAGGGTIDVANASAGAWGTGDTTEGGVTTEVTSVGETYVRKRFDELKSKFSDTDVKISYKILHADDTENFVGLYTREKADLIVYGAAQTSFAGDWFLASEADQLIRKSNTPILIVKGGAVPARFDKLVFASLFDDVTPAVAHSLRYVQELLGSQLHLIRIVPRGSHTEYLQAETEIKYFIEKYAFKNCKTEVFEDNNIESGILRYAENAKADMIAVMSHKTSGSWLKSMLYGSTEQHLVNYANMPVLVFHE